MTRARFVLTALSSVLFVGVAGSVSAEPGDVTLASTSDSGVKGNGDSGFNKPGVSDDGPPVVAFFSSAANLDPMDMDSTPDIYVKDLATGDITLASTSDTGEKGDAGSFNPVLSADGTVVVFHSDAANLDPADTDSVADIYVKDLTTGDITLASTSDQGVKANGYSFFPSLSADGTRVAFGSFATNLDPTDTDSVADIYMKDLTTGDITLASTSGAGGGNGGSSTPFLSTDGTVVSFSTFASNLDPADIDSIEDVYVKNLTTGDLTLASTSDTGVKGNDSSGGTASLSANGTAVAFGSNATNLDPADTDSFVDIYVKDLITGDLTLASTSDSGVKGNNHSFNPSPSPDGTVVAFHSSATNLDPADADGILDVYVKSLTTGELTLASTSEGGDKGDGDSYVPTLSTDGKWVVFISSAANLDPADSDRLIDVYVKELGEPSPSVCDPALSGQPGNDTLIGTPGDDVICGFGGNDMIRGLGGNDTLLGGVGDDRLLGGKGDDTLEGERGADSLTGGEGADILNGGPGADDLKALDGVTGNDTLNGGPGLDRCRLDPGDLATSCRTLTVSGG